MVTRVSELSEVGFAWARGAVSSAHVGALGSLLTVDRPGTRNVLELPEVVRLLRETPLPAMAAELLGIGAIAVRAVLFEKREGVNWALGWHQDVVIAAQARHQVDGYGPWSVKAGVAHVVAPESLLSRMLSFRVHLDDCGEANGPLRVVEGSHRQGRLSEAAAVVTCTAAAGDVLILKPLLLHASSSSQSVASRRVLHIDLAAESLPSPLCWRWDVPFA